MNPVNTKIKIFDTTGYFTPSLGPDGRPKCPIGTSLEERRKAVRQPDGSLKFESTGEMGCREYVLVRVNPVSA